MRWLFNEIRPPAGKEIWRRWQFVYTGKNDRVPCWIVRVPKGIIWGHGGLWSDNSVAMLGAIFRIHFPLTAEGKIAPPVPRLAPRTPDKNYNCRWIGACHLSRAGALAVWIRVRENITAPDVVSDEELFRRGAGTLSQDLDRYFERLPLLVQRRYLQFDPFDRGD
jgi:hypothetical protein